MRLRMAVWGTRRPETEGAAGLLAAPVLAQDISNGDTPAWPEPWIAEASRPRSLKSRRTAGLSSSSGTALLCDGVGPGSQDGLGRACPPLRHAALPSSR